jgi:hypothetical protein
MPEMDSTLKTVLKVAAAVVVPGAAVFFVAKWLLKDVEKEAFKKYIRKTYGEGSNYVDTYN